MDNQSNKLLCVQRVEFDLARKNEKYKFCAQVMVLSIALISIFIQDAITLYVFAFLSLASTASSWYFGSQSRDHIENAHSARRLLLLSDGLGLEIDHGQMADIAAASKYSLEQLAEGSDEGYFSSSEEPGPERLIEILKETSFFSKHLYGIASSLFWWLFAGSMAVCAGILYWLPYVDSHQVSVSIARIVVTFMAFLFSVDLLAKASDFSHAQARTALVLSRAIAMQCNTEASLIPLLGDYNSAVQSAPLIPHPIYAGNRERLTSIYSQSLNTKNA